MARDAGSEVSVASPPSSVARRHKAPRGWARQAEKAAQALRANALAIEIAGPSGIPSDDTLRGQGYVAIPGEKFASQRVAQPLRQQDLTPEPIPTGGKKK